MSNAVTFTNWSSWENNEPVTIEITSVDSVYEAIRIIQGWSEDDEAAHAAEDALYEALLSSIANGRAEDPVAMAAAALETKNIKFCRWCA